MSTVGTCGTSCCSATGRSSCGESRGKPELFSRLSISVQSCWNDLDVTHDINTKTNKNINMNDDSDSD